MITTGFMPAEHKWNRSIARAKAVEALAEILAECDIWDRVLTLQGRRFAQDEGFETYAGRDEFGPWVSVSFAEGPALMQFILDENNGDGIFELIEHVGQGEEIR